MFTGKLKEFAATLEGYAVALDNGKIPLSDKADEQLLMARTISWTLRLICQAVKSVA